MQGDGTTAFEQTSEIRLVVAMIGLEGLEQAELSLKRAGLDVTGDVNSV
jgi:hypothetical protein